MKNKKVLLLILTFLIIINSALSNEDKTIKISLDYGTEIPWDIDNDGIESKNSVIDFTLQNTIFSWLPIEDNLCTIWEIYSFDKDDVGKTCYGSKKCCNFLDIETYKNKWNDAFYLKYESENYKVSAKVIYVDFSLDLSNPYMTLIESDWDYLYAKFIDIKYANTLLSLNNAGNYDLANLLTNLQSILEVISVSLTDKENDEVANLTNETIYD